MWSFPTKSITLNKIDVHLWCMNLDLSKEQVDQRFQILNDQEQIKAQRFRFEQHQRRFIVARSTLKNILSHYLQIPPVQITFEYSYLGKPKLSDEINSRQLEFNLSHSQELAIYGITCDRLIGVDVEYIRPMSDAEQLAKRFFCPQEAEKIKTLSPPDKDQAFFQLWTAKEAYLKATGEGISGGLDKVEISLDSPLQLINLPHWQLLSFVPQIDYLAAIVVPGNLGNVSYWKAD
ncbi:4'-phosphopantetheinyl transferase superfamily protein [Crocosphaera sp. UHCC 0190]|uniref:4'-phosphopantetheinyl transferase family protein n=1 Tax=Crocosphaera sp. UHCC 0190 TaxID=3110246 RepID=UPI002B204655|nr:4'-phosphopantetheinyl transferase superfamily protein [Crocosphaera sp. UHCC 0190]MEA5511279.1 4'-phosphopantetheinyl transferase superfamily protein [Crocosphaera sp. UHCC 0190]